VLYGPVGQTKSQCPLLASYCRIPEIAMTDTLSITIRELGAGDVPSLRGINALFGRVFGDADAYEGAPPSEAWLERLLATRSFIALLAEEANGATVGGLTAYELVKFERERSEIYIYDLAVAESLRRRGIASRLIATLREIAGRRGAYVIFVQADLTDDAAIALYTRLGLREEVLHFDFPVQDAPKQK
jgi:aminoglycoside 3-N-acetyltransferase I